MHYLCALIFLFVVSVTQASTQKMNTEYSYQSSQLPRDSIYAQTQPLAEVQTSTIGYEGQELSSGFSISASAQFQQPDYSKYLIYNENKQKESLSNSVSTHQEIYGSSRFDYATGANLYSFTFFGHLSNSPFYTRGAQFNYQYGFYEKTTTAGFRAIYLKQDQPFSYYVDSLLQSHQRPTMISAQELALSIEQVINSTMKTYAEISTSQRIRERPQNWGGKVKYAWAPTNHWFHQFSLSSIAEDRSQDLMNERGYFSIYGGEWLVTYEPMYDLLVSLSFGSYIEKEKDPRISNEVQVGTDQIGLGMSYKTYSNIQFKFKGAYAKSNTDVETVILSGGIEWPI